MKEAHTLDSATYTNLMLRLQHQRLITQLAFELKVHHHYDLAVEHLTNGIIFCESNECGNDELVELRISRSDMRRNCFLQQEENCGDESEILEDLIQAKELSSEIGDLNNKIINCFQMNNQIMNILPKTMVLWQQEVNTTTQEDFTPVEAARFYLNRAKLLSHFKEQELALKDLVSAREAGAEEEEIHHLENTIMEQEATQDYRQHEHSQNEVKKEAEAQQKQENWGKALELWGFLLEQNPDDNLRDHIHFNRALCFFKLNQCDRTLEELNLRRGEIRSYLVAFLLETHCLATSENSLDQAIANYREISAFRFNRLHQTVRRFRGVKHPSKWLIDEAKQSLDEALARKEGRNYEGLVDHAYAYFNQANYTAALDKWNEAEAVATEENDNSLVLAKIYAGRASTWYQISLNRVQVEDNIPPNERMLEDLDKAHAQSIKLFPRSMVIQKAIELAIESYEKDHYKEAIAQWKVVAQYAEDHHIPVDSKWKNFQALVQERELRREAKEKAAEEFKAKGVEAVRHQDYEEALERFEDAIKYSEVAVLPASTIAQLHYARAEVFDRAGKLVEALFECDAAIELTSSYFEPQFLKIQCLRRLGGNENLTNARTLAQELLQGASSEQQIQLLNEERINPLNPFRVLVNGCEKLMEDQKHEEALECWNQSLESAQSMGDTDNAKFEIVYILGHRGRTLNMLQRYKEATDDFNRVLEADKGNTIARAGLRDAALWQGHIRSAATRHFDMTVDTLKGIPVRIAKTKALEIVKNIMRAPLKRYDQDTYYDILEVSVKASRETIRDAYSSLMQRLQRLPRTAEIARKEAEANAALETLLNDERRLAYDLKHKLRICLRHVCHYVYNTPWKSSPTANKELEIY